MDGILQNKKVIIIEKELTIGSLFSGYGGIELGLEATKGFKSVWHCEIEAYPSAILAERWPECPNLGDITRVDWQTVKRPDVLCGGFPCQDISQAGKQRGIIKGETRSGLWGEFHKAIRILRPKYVLIENVSALAILGLNIVLSDLAEIGYDAEWLDIRASDFGAPHKRERIFIIAYPNADNRQCKYENETLQSRWNSSVDVCSDVSDTDCSRQQEPRRSEPDGKEHATIKCHDGWEVEPDVGRVVDGITKGLDSYIWRERIKACGNGVVPQITKWIGEQILSKEQENKGEKVNEN